MSPPSLDANAHAAAHGPPFAADAETRRRGLEIAALCGQPALFDEVLAFARLEDAQLNRLGGALQADARGTALTVAEVEFELVCQRGQTGGGG